MPCQPTARWRIFGDRRGIGERKRGDWVGQWRRDSLGPRGVPCRHMASACACEPAPRGISVSGPNQPHARKRRPDVAADTAFKKILRICRFFPFFFNIYARQEFRVSLRCLAILLFPFIATLRYFHYCVTVRAGPWRPGPADMWLVGRWPVATPHGGPSPVRFQCGGHARRRVAWTVDS